MTNAAGPRRGRSRRSTTIATIVAMLVVLLPGAAPATAAPAQAWLGLDGVQSMLAAQPDGVPAGLRTVLGGPTAAGQQPVDLPVTLHAVVADAGLAGSLILLAADLSDPRWQAIGTIASGMSGSPIVVEHAGAPKVVGALSYGDIFTTGGLGLATPIEDMIAVEARGLTGQAVPGTVIAPRPRAIEPLTVGDRTISSVVVESSGALSTASLRAQAESDADTAYFLPLLALQVGGLPAGSSAYKRLRASMAAHGLRLVSPRGTGPAGGSDDFTTPLAPGAAAGAFLALGDLSFGGIGTITYTTPANQVVAFGHPFMWSGRSEAFLTNAWIDGIWSSSMSSYKLGSPGSIRGTVVQDRAAGIGATLDSVADGVPVTARATVTADGSATTASGVTTVAPATFRGWLRSDLPAAATMEPIYEAADAETMPGSARTTLTVGVTDGTTSYVVERSNIFDDSGDVLGQPGFDVYSVLETLLANPMGTAAATVTSVDLTTEITEARARARIRGIASPGLRTGSNTLQVIVRPFGSSADVEVPVTLTLPPGMPTQGMVRVIGGAELEIEPQDASSLQAVVDGINGAPTNSDILVEYSAMGTSLPPIRQVVATESVVDGAVEATTSAIEVQVSPSTSSTGRTVSIQGAVLGAGDSSVVRVERRTWGSSTWRTVAAGAPVAAGLGTFEVTDTPRYSAVYRVTFAGSGGTVLGSSATVTLPVRGRVSLGATVRGTGIVLAARVAPARAGSKVTFERYSSGRWRALRTVLTTSTGRASWTWAAQPGTYRLRARLSSTVDLKGSVSAPIRVRR